MGLEKVFQKKSLLMHEKITSHRRPNCDFPVLSLTLEAYSTQTNQCDQPAYERSFSRDRGIRISPRRAPHFAESSRVERGIPQSKRGSRKVTGVINQLVRDPSLRSG